MNNRAYWILPIAVLLVAGAVLASPQTFAAFRDIAVSSPNATAIESLRSQGIVSGYPDGTFDEHNFISRAEFLKIVLEARAKALGHGAVAKDSAGCTARFSDLPAEDWSYGYVCKAVKDGVVSGYPDGTFLPGQTINFAEASKMLSLAFGQKIDAVGSDWYEPYVRSLETSKAIPQNIAAFDQSLTRGDMAQMIWRLTEKRTDSPSKGYLNVKYPGISLNMATDTIQTATSCKDLATLVQAYGSDDTWMKVRRDGGDVIKEDRAAQNMMAPSATAGSALQAPDEDSYSQTNVQVTGVDEADIVKTDGTYVYIVSNDNGPKVRIVKAYPGSAMTETAAIDLSNESTALSDLYVDGNRLIVIGNDIQYVSQSYGGTSSEATVGAGVARRMDPGFVPPIWGGGARTSVRIYDISDKSKPSLLRKVVLDGSQLSTRRIGSKLYIVLNQSMRWQGGPMPLASAKNSGVVPSDVLPMIADSANGGTEQPMVGCASVSIMPHVPSPQFLIVAVVPTDSVNTAVQRSVVLGSAQNVYMSEQSLYVATPVYRYAWDGTGSDETKTVVYRFAVTDAGIELKNQGSVPGTILNQFSMDENGQTFRIATTKGQVWSSSAPSSNNLYVLNTDMETVGSIEGIAPSESIYAVRFVGDRAYMVTFQSIDPLFVIDTSDARNPKILGTLKIPGYSDYLQPYDATHLIGFGKEVDASIDKDKVHSDNAVYYTAVQGLKIALFDVSDVSNPKEIAKEVIGDRGSDSPLLTNHKALLFDKDRNLLAFPVTVTKMPTNSSVSDSYVSPDVVFQGAYVYDISLSGFSLRGKITHLNADDLMKSGMVWMAGNKDIQRILRIGDSLLTVSPSLVQSHTLQTVQKEGEVELSQ